MKYCLTPMFVFFILCGCSHPFTNDKASFAVDEDAIKKNLEKVATGFLKSWEPPFDPDGALSYFTQTEDFNLVSDGHETATYTEWAGMVPKWMAFDAGYYKSYTHEIKKIKTVVLSANSGVITVVYIWDSVSNDDVHERLNGAITLTCREENGVWKIVHYHGSHYNPGEEGN